jgi:hypothetical protein
MLAQKFAKSGTPDLVEMSGTPGYFEHEVMMNEENPEE